MFETGEERRERADAEERENHRRWRRRHSRSRAHALAGLVAGVFVGGLALGMYAIARRIELAALRSELPDHLKALAEAERAYESHNGGYLTIGSPVDAYEAMEAGRGYSPGAALGVRAEGVRGAYWVIGNDSTFEAHGLLDADRDGFPAHWVATETQPPRPITDDGVY